MNKQIEELERNVAQLNIACDNWQNQLVEVQQEKIEMAKQLAALHAELARVQAELKKAKSQFCCSHSEHIDSDNNGACPKCERKTLRSERDAAVRRAEYAEARQNNAERILRDLQAEADRYTTRYGETSFANAVIRAAENFLMV